MRFLVILCAMTSLAHADPQCPTLPAGRTVEVANGTLYALHDNSFGTNDLFVISLGPQPVLRSRVSFRFKASWFSIAGSQLRIAGYDAKFATRVIALDVGDPAAPRFVGEGIACRLPEPLPPITSTPDRDVRAVTVRIGNVIEVWRSAKQAQWIDHAALVTANHWELVRFVGPGECGRYPAGCSQAYLETRLRAVEFERIHVEHRIIYSVSQAGIAAHALDDLKLVGSLRWPTLQAVMPISVLPPSPRG